MALTNDEIFMRAAINVTRTGMAHGQSPFGAVIVKGTKIIAKAHNTVWADEDSTAHAEVNAIRQACKNLNTIDLSGCAIYSTTEPCPMCFSAIHWARIGKIVYGASIADARNAGFHELEISDAQMNKLGRSKIKIEKSVLKDECVALFKEWKTQKGKPY